MLCERRPAIACTVPGWGGSHSDSRPRSSSRHSHPEPSDKPGAVQWQVTDLLKQHAPTAHIPVVAVTANTQNFYRGRAEAMGCDAFLEKPCPPTLLLEMIERLLDPDYRL